MCKVVTNKVDKLGYVSVLFFLRVCIRHGQISYAAQLALHHFEAPLMFHNVRVLESVVPREWISRAFWRRER